MARPYSLDLRERPVACVAAGESVRSIAAVLRVSAASVVKWSQRLRATGCAAAGPMHGYRPRLLPPHRDWLLSRMGNGRDFTLRGLQAELAERGVRVDYRTVWNFVHAEGLIFNKSVLPSEQERPDIARFRARWKKSQGARTPSASSSSTKPGRSFDLMAYLMRAGTGTCPRANRAATLVRAPIPAKLAPAPKRLSQSPSLRYQLRAKTPPRPVEPWRRLWLPFDSGRASRPGLRLAALLSIWRPPAWTARRIYRSGQHGRSAWCLSNCGWD